VGKVRFKFLFDVVVKRTFSVDLGDSIETETALRKPRLAGICGRKMFEWKARRNV